MFGVFFHGGQGAGDPGENGIGVTLVALGVFFQQDFFGNRLGRQGLAGLGLWGVFHGCSVDAFDNVVNGMVYILTVIAKSVVSAKHTILA